MTWYGTFDGPPFYHAENVASEGEFPLTQIGINRPMENVYLSEAYAVPRQECWGYGLYKICSIQTEKGTLHYDMGANFRQDVLPRTLTEFYELAEPAGAGKGYALAWGQVGDLKFPILADADGDGLLREGDPGDPDDFKWDADGDGLSDVYELQNGLDPLMSDPDSDGLSDLQEVRLGTDPWLRDSDDDGLLDCQEAFHQVIVAGDPEARDACGGLGTWSGGWEIVYEPEPGTRSNTLVTSNPLEPDTDGDGLTDHREMVYGYNPRVYSVLRVLSLDSKLSEEGLPVSDGVVAPGQSLAYDATVKNELDNRRAEGLLWTVPADVLDPSAINPVRPQSFDLWAQEQVPMAGDLVVDGEASTGVYTVTQVAGALITDPRVESGRALLWLPFDDAQDATVFSDESGYGHDGVCAGSGCTLQPATGRIGGALQLAGSGYVRSEAAVPTGPYGVSFWFKTQAASGHLFYADTQVSGTYRVQVYLSAGTICGTIPGDATGRCTASTYNDGKWHHVVHTDRGSAAGGQMVYVDGSVAIGQGATSSTTWVSKAGAMIGGKSGSYLVGSIDDVRLFSDTLGAAQVQDLFNTPIFRMDFSDTSAWKDVSDSPATISTCTPECPAQPTAGFAGGYADFDGTQHLHVEAAPKLNLSAGRFTLAAWINPRTRPPLAGKRNARDDFPQGIVGLESGTRSAYPTLQRVGKKIRFSLGTGTAWAEPYTSGEVLTENRWNHVVLTLDAEDPDNQLRLYVNGDLVEAKPFPYTPPSTIQSFDIGRSSSSASVSVSKLYSSWPAYTPSPSGSELHLDVGGQELWNAVLTGFGYEVSINKVKAFTGDTSLGMYHEGLTKNYQCSFEGYGEEIKFSTTEPSIDSTGYLFDGCGEGELYLSYANESIPFYGYMDEVQIFGRPLDPDSVRRLYLDIVTDLHLPLDEAPGAEAFQDTSLPYVPASCDGDGCPASGVAGRLDAAVWFDPDDEDSILLGNFGDFTATSVAAWVYRAADTGARETVVSYKEGSGCGFVLAVEDDVPKFWVNVNGSWPAITGTGYQVPLNEWVHLAGTYDGTSLRLYYNGNEIATPVSAPGSIKQCTAKTAIGSRNSQDNHWFSGLIDDVWILDTALPQERIADIYGSAPALHLRFEEAQGADRFADNADADRFGTCTGDACPVTGEGVRGQIGLAAQFDGVDDSISLGDVNELDGLDDFTIAQWFYLDSLSPSSSGWAAPVGKGRFDTSPAWSVLVNTDANNIPSQKINLYLNGAPRASIPAPAGGWALGQWYHYAFTRRGSTVKGYLNGIEKVTGTYSDVIADNSYLLRVGVHEVGPYYWPGKLDDLRLYRRAITASQIWDQYLYESAWVEDRQSQRITVDDDVPTAEILLGDGTWLPWDGTAYVVGVTANDPTSDIASVELCWRLGDAGTITCDSPEPAEPCAPEVSQPEGAWCATYKLPHGEVSTDYQLLARATDGVGHKGPWSNPVHVWTDCGRPQVSLDQAAVRVDVAASPERNRWVVHLSGTVLDPPCQANASAVTSGVPPDGVHVTVRQAGDPEHKALGTAGQTATVTRTGSTPNWSGVWSLDYEVPKAAVDGCYEAVVEAADHMALIPDPSGNNARKHTGTSASPIALDGSGPAVLLDWQPAIAGGVLGPDVARVDGPTSDRPVPVQIDLTAVSGAKDTRVWLTCRQGATTDWHTLFDLPEGGLADGSDRHWAGEIHRGSSCQVNLTTVAPAAEVSGTVKTGDEQIEVANWSGSFSGSKTVPFAVYSSACMGPDSSPDPTPEPPWEDEVLRLPFDEPAGAPIFHDASGNGNDAACPDPARCPAAGQAGHVVRAVRFDGTDDYLSAPGLIQRSGGASLTVAFWAKRDATNTRDYVVSQGGSLGFRMGYHYQEFVCFVDTGLAAPGPYYDTDWHHWACTYGWRWDEEGQRWIKYTTLYRDGQFEAQASTISDSPELTGNLQIGRYEWGSGVFWYYRGAVDDLRILHRTLTAAEVKSLYMGTGPVLVLPFETSPATDGTTLPDASGWAHNGTLHTGDALNKAVSGQVGTYALSFDGTDDYVSLGDVDDLDELGDFSIAEWFYLDTLGSAVNGRDWAAPVGKGRFNTSPAWSVLVNTDSSNTSLHRINLYLNGQARAGIAGPEQGWQTGRWYHYVFTRSGGTITGYLDGVQRVTSSYSAAVGSTSSPVLIGKNETERYWWPGRLDDLRIYRRSMTAAEVNDLYNSGVLAVAGVEKVDVAFRPVLPGSAFLNEVPLQDEVVHLPFEDTPTSDGGLVLRDVSGSGLNGSCTNCPAPGQAGPAGNAAWFDGVDDAVSLGDVNALDGLGDLTIAEWFYLDSLSPASIGWAAPAGKGLFSKPGWSVLVNTVSGKPAGHKINLYLNGAPRAWIMAPAGGWVLGRWYHYAFTRSGSTMRGYLNGVEQPAGWADYANVVTDNSAPVLVGVHEGGYYSWPGRLDELRIFRRALDADDVKGLYHGSGPLLALSFDEPWALDGEALPDASGWDHPGTLETGTGDPANKATLGQVGPYALSFDGTDDYVRLGDFQVEGQITLAAWVKLGASADADGLRNIIAHGYTTSPKEGEVFLRIADGAYQVGSWDSSGTHAAVWKDPYGVNYDWVHLAGVYDGSAWRLYVGGWQASAAPSDVGAVPVEANWAVGARGGGGERFFKGKIDEVRIYARALSAPEIAELYHSSWQVATLTGSVDDGVSRNWASSVPHGLEGSYQVEMRGRDAAGHVKVMAEPSLLWSGEADNLAPRLSLSRQLVSGSTYRYTAAAQDYHLDKASYRSPCGSSVTPTYTDEYYQSPWYVGSGAGQKLFGLTAVCDLAGTPSTATICDSLGNCTTCDYSNNCTTSVVAVAAAGSLEAGQEAALDAAAAPAAKPGPAGFEIIVPAVVTASHYYEPGTIDVAGQVTSQRQPGAGDHDLVSVQVAIAGQAGPAIVSAPAAGRPYTVTWTFPWHLEGGAPLPDGAAYTAVVTATDLAGRTTVADRTLIADVVRPAAVTLSLAANGLPVEPGAIIRESSPGLALTWTASSDGSGLAPYLAAWRFEDAYTTTIQTSLHDPAGPREVHAAAGEAQRVSVGLAGRDVYGNTRGQAFGSVIVDGPLTPDYCSLSPEADITGSACTLLGTDRRIARRTNTGRWTEQRMYGTWDHQALRLAWTGAHWSGDGDLFVYLDTEDGGTTTAFSPYTVAITGTLVTLPADLAADVLVWVQDRRTANLMRWDGSQWVFETSLSSAQYRFDGGRNGGQTDLYLPFELLGTAAGAPLGLLAFAAEEPAADIGLRLWATLPLANPVNSDRVNIRRGLAPAGSTMPLFHAYRWAALDDGVCPNGTNGVLAAEQHNDAVIELSVESNPPGATASGMSGGLFWVANPGTLLGVTPVEEPTFGFLRANQPPLPDGQEIVYTVRYRNEGSHTLAGARLALSAFGALRLAGDTRELGDIPAGGEGSVTFQATVDRSLSPYGLAAVLGRLYATNNGDSPLEWFADLHRVDKGAPEEMGLDGTEVVVGPGSGRLGGFARDESGVSQVEIEVTSPSGTISTLICELPEGSSGGWSCPWDATVANGGLRPADGDTFTVRLRATDRLGQTSDWSLPHSIRVDAQPPNVTMPAELSGIYAGRLVRGNALRLVGDALDNHALGSVTLCLQPGDTCRTADLGTPVVSASGWSRWLRAPGAMDYLTRTLTISATDRLGNSLPEPLSLPLVFDNVPPVLNAGQLLARVPVGSAETVLSGEVTDGGPAVRVWVRVQPPQEGDLTRVLANSDGATWQFELPAAVVGQHTLWADAEDAAGNVTTAGPFTVDVTCTDAVLAVTSLTAEPVVGSPMSLMLTVVISNAGPAGLPAGIPIVVAEGINPTGRVTTTIPLAAGEWQALSLVWGPSGARDHDLGVTAGLGAVLPDGPLCVAPPTTRFPVSLRDTALAFGWNLISPQLQPGQADIQTVQRGIDGPYSAILGYDGGPLAYYPDDPEGSNLKTVDALHGYWVHTSPATDTLRFQTAATWRIAGEILPEDQPLSLAAGWNLVGYLPRRRLAVTTALVGIAGSYSAVLGFEHTALSTYPDLDPSYNTLAYMAPGYGYWIDAAEAVSLHYPITTITDTLTVTETRPVYERLFSVVTSEWQAGVQPTDEWVNYYGELSLPDGSPVPTGTVVLAVDPGGIVCGATMVWEPGQFGLLACYRDDPNTGVDEGAEPGDLIQLFFSTDGTQPDGQLIGACLWTAHGDRCEVGQEVQPVVDLVFTKEVVPGTAEPGATITYTLVYTNAGTLVAQGAVIGDRLPAEIEAISYSYAGATITLTVGSEGLAWQVADLAPGASGIITLTGILSPALSSPLILTNTATITAPLEMRPEDNLAQAVLQVSLPPPPGWTIWLPLILREAR